MNDNSFQHLNNRLTILKRRLAEREIQSAKAGIMVDPMITMEIEDLRKEIQEIETSLREQETSKTSIRPEVRRKERDYIPGQTPLSREAWGCIGVVIAALITGICALIVALIPQMIPLFNPLPTTTPTLSEPEYIGRVLDGSNLQPIAGAKITLTLEGVPPIVYSDNEGVYRFTVEVDSSISGQVRVDAPGYQIYTRTITISIEQKTIEDIRLTPLSP